MYYLSINSSNLVSFDVEYDYTNRDSQIKHEHLSRSGRVYVYKWGELRKRTFSVRFVSSSTAAIVNSWWNSNTSLILREENSTDVFSCRISNDSTPISRFEKPHNDKLRGVIELESY